MIRNYIKIALRNLRKYRQFSIINIFGLSFSIAVSLSLLLYVYDELSYDAFHPDASRLSRVTMQTQVQEKDFHSAWTPAFIGSRMRSDLSEVEDYATLYKHFKGYAIKKDEEEIAINDVYYSSPNFFSFFGFDLNYGNPEDVLSEPGNIVLHEKLVDQLFAGEMVMGKTIETSDGSKKITGIISDNGQNSHFTPMAVSSIIGRWDAGDLATAVQLDAAYYNYIKTSKGSNLNDTKINQLAALYFKEWINAEESRKESFGRESISLQLQNVKDIHLNSHLEFEMDANGNKSTVIVFGLIAILILIVACINYTNLASTRYLERMKELGIRKVLGSRRRQLAAQYLTESLVITSISALAGWIIVQFSLPFFNEISGKTLGMAQLFQLEVFIGFLLMIFSTAVLSSLYPSFFVSGIKPANIFKINNTGTGKGSRFRKSMLVIQISVSGILLVFTFVIFQQLRFMQQSDLGFEKDQVVVIEVKASEARSKLPTLKKELLKYTSVKSIGLTGQVPGSENLKTESFGYENSDGGFSELLTNYMFSGPDVMKALELSIATGQNFNAEKGEANRGQEVIVNETLAKAMNWKNPIGKKVKIPIGEALVVGVIDDFHLKSMHHKIEPLTIIYLDNWADALLVKIGAKDLNQTILDIKKTYQEVLGLSVFEYSFLDDRFARQYQSDQQEANLFIIFSVLTVMISGLGLLGLIGFSLARRSKEISIRRVFGASYSQILKLLLKEYGQIILIGLLIVIPLANYFIKDWLNNFSYKMELSVLHFALPILGLSFLITGIILFQSYSTTQSNPAKVLQEE